MKSLVAFIIFSIAAAAWGSSADSLNTVVDLEAKITQKVKAILQPVDPDAIIVTKVEVKRTTTDILGTQLTAVGIFATGDLQKIEDTDIDSINVTVITKIEKIPAEISKYVETAVIGVSKKGRVQFTRMDATTVDVIMKRQESQKLHTEGFQRLVYLVDQMYKKAGSALLGLLIGFALVELAKALMGGFFQSKSSTKLGNKIAAIKVGSSSEEASRPMVVQQSNAGGPAGASRGGEVTVTGGADKNPLELMSAESLRALFSDAYWCEKDHYAAWAWSQLSPSKKIELLESWNTFESYAVYLARVEPNEDRFHLDPSYLRPQSCHQVSNQDLLKVLKTNKAIWLSFSQMRRQSMPLTLQERVEFAKMPPIEAPGTLGPKLWGSMTSPLRRLPVQLGISTLTDQDEMLLMTNPEMITGAMRRQVPTLVWVALLPKADREKLLQKVSAQNLAEVWLGPAQTLQLLLEVLPEKKRELLKDYAKKVTPSRDLPLVATLANSALDVFEKAAAPKIPDMNEKKAA
ncbi:hypothetical protein [Bdellovibrio sp. HCB337]|uniref:hypothetical protein n=1 Tax=Bdellovibrio sp. HCB337 TaxID=3394358 RepID=UPI0039A4E4A1